MAMDTIEVTRPREGTLEFTAREAPERGRHAAEEEMNGHNVGSLERGASLFGGGALVVGGLRQGGVRGFGSALLGGVLLYRGATGYCPVYGSLGVSTADEEGRQSRVAEYITAQRDIRMDAVAIVNRPVDELYRFWRDPLNLPRFMKSITSVEPLSDHRAQWTLKPPVGPAIPFVSEITHETEGRAIGWQSEDSTVLEHTGEVRFRELPTGRGTEVRLKLDFTPPAGALGGGVARLFDGAMETQLRAELKRLKQFMETGEIATTEGQPSARNR